MGAHVAHAEYGKARLTPCLSGSSSCSLLLLAFLFLFVLLLALFFLAFFLLLWIERLHVVVEPRVLLLVGTLFLEIIDARPYGLPHAAPSCL